MGWADCGTDSQGRPIGYAFEAMCDDPKCETGIDRGLDAACGGMHGESSDPAAGLYCERYYCGMHTYSHYCDALERERTIDDDGHFEALRPC